MTRRQTNPRTKTIPGDDLSSWAILFLAGGLLLLSIQPQSIPRKEYVVQSVWTLEQSVGNGARLEFPLDHGGEIQVRMDWIRVDCQPENIRLSRRIEIPDGSLVRLHFRARAEGSKTIRCQLSEIHAPRPLLASPAEFTLTDAWTEHEHIFRVEEGHRAVAVEFLLGGDAISCAMADVVVVTETVAEEKELTPPAP